MFTGRRYRKPRRNYATNTRNKNKKQFIDDFVVHTLQSLPTELRYVAAICASVKVPPRAIVYVQCMCRLHSCLGDVSVTSFENFRVIIHEK